MYHLYEGEMIQDIQRTTICTRTCHVSRVTYILHEKGVHVVYMYTRTGTVRTNKSFLLLHVQYS